jgi:hypothetical protein
MPATSRFSRTAGRSSRFGAVALALILLLAPSVAGAQQTGSVAGRIVDRSDGTPVSDALVVLDGTRHSTVTGPNGRFRLEGIVAGQYVLRVRHLAYGNQTQIIDIPGGRDLVVQLSISQRAIELEPIILDVLSAEEVRRRAAGFNVNRVTRDQIERVQDTNLNIGDVLRMHAPGVRVRRYEALPGTPVCVEFRSSARSSLRECRSPVVYLDGVPVAAPEQLLASLSLTDIESMEIIPSVEAGARYGMGAGNGALLIETRRPAPPITEETVERTVLRPLNHDWATETTSHATGRVYLYSALGGMAGLTAGVLLADQCLGLRSPSYDSVITDCDPLPTMASAVAAIALPALGGGLAARLGGATDMSRGRLWPALVGASMVLVPGYALVLSGRRSSDSGAIQWVGTGLLALGAPLAVTLADKLFRSVRPDP